MSRLKGKGFIVKDVMSINVFLLLTFSYWVESAVNKNEATSAEALNSVIPVLCDKAKYDKNYNDDFLDNFKTLKEGEDGWLYRNYDLKDRFGPSGKGFVKLAELAETLSASGTQLLLIPIPTRGLVETKTLGTINYDVQAGRKAYLKYLENLRFQGLEVPDLSALFTTGQEQLAVSESTLFFSRDHHWNSQGAKRIASLTAKHIKLLDIYSALNKSDYRTKAEGQGEVNGSLQRAASKICNSAYPAERFDKYTTESLASDDLFEELPKAEVVLVGTSNSKGRLNFNFSGFLREYSQLNVLNMAVSGGGYGGALKKYLLSDDFVRRPPKILIWELPSYYSLSDAAFFDELMKEMNEVVK